MLATCNVASLNLSCIHLTLIEFLPTVFNFKADIISNYDYCDLCDDGLSISGSESARDQAPGVFLRDDPICGTQLENQSELRATSADRAAHLLDAAIAARTVPGSSHTLPPLNTTRSSDVISLMLVVLLFRSRG